MAVALRHDSLFTEDEYLAGEELAEQRHEFLNGVVYCMAGGTRSHSAVIMNIAGTLHRVLRGKRCRPYAEGFKLRIQRGADSRFYYPDSMVVCQRSASELWENEPVVLMEVLSESTERTDRTEKRDAYLAIPSLDAYAIVDSRRMRILVYRRTESGWQTEELTSAEHTLRLPAIECELSLAEIYEGVF